MSASFSENDTIAAKATSSGAAGIGVIRVSGPLALSIAKAVGGCSPRPRYATYCSFKSNTGVVLDEGIVLYFKAPHSFTGEDVLELQGHGGRIVLDSLLEAVLKAGARLARPGEFSERAFLNGKIDLLQAEAIAGLIEASSEQAARSAVRSLQGEFSKEIHKLRDLLIQLQMRIEAEIDFPEEDVPVTDKAQILEQLTVIYQHILEIQSRTKQGVLIGEGLNVALIGKPNTGKSSLLNYFSGEERAIVTDIEGTTRDIIRETILLDGVPIHLSDTAGIRETGSLIEQEGINRAKRLAKEADLVLYLVDAEKQKDYRVVLETMQVLRETVGKQDIIVRNKIDLTDDEPGLTRFRGIPVANISITHGWGLRELKEYLKAQAGLLSHETSDLFSRKRHVVAIEETEKILKSSLHQFNENTSVELLSEDLRLAQRKLSEILGEFTADDLLGKIFSEFCIGK